MHQLFYSYNYLFAYIHRQAWVESPDALLSAMENLDGDINELTYVLDITFGLKSHNNIPKIRKEQIEKELNMLELLFSLFYRPNIVLGEINLYLSGISISSLLALDQGNLFQILNRKIPREIEESIRSGWTLKSIPKEYKFIPFAYHPSIGEWGFREEEIHNAYSEKIILNGFLETCLHSLKLAFEIQAPSNTNITLSGYLEELSEENKNLFNNRHSADFNQWHSDCLSMLTERILRINHFKKEQVDIFGEQIKNINLSNFWQTYEKEFQYTIEDQNADIHRREVNHEFLSNAKYDYDWLLAVSKYLNELNPSLPKPLGVSDIYEINSHILKGENLICGYQIDMIYFYSQRLNSRVYFPLFSLNDEVAIIEVIKKDYVSWHQNPEGEVVASSPRFCIPLYFQKATSSLKKILENNPMYFTQIYDNELQGNQQIQIIAMIHYSKFVLRLIQQGVIANYFECSPHIPFPLNCNSSNDDVALPFE